MPQTIMEGSVARQYLHPVHGLPQSVQLVRGAQGFQPDVSQLHLFVAELVAQLQDAVRFVVRTLRQAKITSKRNEPNRKLPIRDITLS